MTTTLLNHNEREGLIALKAHEAFCMRGCQHGSDLDDWLNAERQLSPLEGDVVLSRAASGCVLSIASRPEQPHIVLSIAPDSVLILWTQQESDEGNDDIDISRLTVALASLPWPIDPERAQVHYREGRAWLDLPCHDSRDLETSAGSSERELGEATARPAQVY